MKQKGRRFVAEEKPKKNKKVVKPIEFETAKTDNSKRVVEPETEKSDKEREKMKENIERKLEKNRAKALRKSRDKSKTSVLSEGTDSSKVLKFERKDEINSKFEKFSDTVKNNRKTIVMSSVIILVLLLSVLIFANRDRLSFSSIKNWVEYGVFNKDNEEHFPISTDSEVVNDGNFSRIDRNLVFASDTKFVTLNNYGRTIFENPQAFSTPVLTQAADSDLSLTYNLGGKGFSIYTLDSLVYTGEAEDNIIVADISKSGTYALVTEKDGYLSKLYVYNEDNQQIFAYSFADYYITCVSLDSKGESAVLSGVSAHDGTQYSAVYMLNFTKEEPVIFEEFEDNMLYYVEHLTNNYVCIIGDTSCYTMNAISKSFNTTTYDGKALTAFDVNTDTNTFSLSLSRSADGRKCDILVFSTSGTLRETISTQLKITSLSTYKNRVAAISLGNAYLYSKDGTLLSEKDAGLDPHAIVLYSTNDAYILGVSEIRRLDL